MSSPESDPLPDEPDQLAALAAGEAGRDALRERARQALDSLIRRIARTLSIGFSGQLRQDLIDEAPAFIWERLGTFRGECRFASWCWRCLRNRAKDWCREAGRRGRYEQQASRQRPEAFTPWPALERADSETSPFTAADLDAVEGWPARQRLALLYWSGLWGKVPSAQWGRWVTECREEHQVPQGDPFPPDDLDDGRIPAARITRLAELFQVMPNTVVSWLSRGGRERLGQLRYVQDLMR